MRRSRLGTLLLLTPLVLTSCVGVGEKLNEIANETWNGFFAASVDPAFFVSLTGKLLAFLAVIVGALAIWGIIKWGGRKDSWPTGLFLVLLLIAMSPFFMNIFKAMSDWFISGTPYGLTYIFESMGWTWPPEGDLDLKSLGTAVGLTVALPLISMGWEVFVVLPFDATMIVAAALSKSRKPLWLALGVTLGWMLTRPVHYIAVSIINVNRPDGPFGALVSTAVSLNGWYFWGTIAIVSILWVIGPALVALFMLIVWIRGWMRNRRQPRGGGGSGGIVAPIPTGGGNGEDGEDDGSGKSPGNDNLDGTPRNKTPSGDGERKKGNGANSESEKESNLDAGKDTAKGKNGESGSKRAGEGASGRNRYVRIKGATRTSGDKTFHGWKNPDTGGVDWFPEGFDPNNLGGSGNNLDAEGSPQASRSSVRSQKADEGADGVDANNLDAASGKVEDVPTGTGDKDNLTGEAIDRQESHQPSQNPPGSEEVDGAHNLDEGPVDTDSKPKGADGSPDQDNFNQKNDDSGQVKANPQQSATRGESTGESRGHVNGGQHNLDAASVPQASTQTAGPQNGKHEEVSEQAHNLDGEAGDSHKGDTPQSLAVRQPDQDADTLEGSATSRDNGARSGTSRTYQGSGEETDLRTHSL